MHNYKWFGNLNDKYTIVKVGNTWMYPSEFFFFFFRVQDVCILFAVIVVFLLFFNTYIFQAGLVNILIEKFKVAIGITFVYFGLNVGLHVWEMVGWMLTFMILPIVQRILSLWMNYDTTLNYKLNDWRGGIVVSKLILIVNQTFTQEEFNKVNKKQVNKLNK